MISISEHSELMSNRESFYRFLGRLYKVEVDQALLDRMKCLRFPVECGETELAEGYRMLENYLARPEPDALTDLAVDFAKVFLGAGIADETAVAYPYESVYTSPDRLIMQDARDQVVAAYRSKGLDKAEALDVPEDHIALELEFMACLCREAQDLVAADDGQPVSGGIKEQRDFLVQHLLNWVPAFCADVQKFAETDFYKAVAKITNGYLNMEQAIIEDWIADTAVQAV